MHKWYFSKGHGTQNDFVVLLDRHGMLPLTAASVRRLTHRRAGIGADGVLRAIKARHIPEWRGDPELWFMDYRNADGSIAEMCGNGLRVFVRYLLEENLVSGEQIDIATRAGLRTVWQRADGQLRTSMGPARITGELTVQAEGREWPATSVDVGNPHAVVFLESVDELAALRLQDAPTWTPASHFPDGANIEFVVAAPDRLTMRVFERGSGETDSCGTGVVATAAAWANREGRSSAEIQVDVRGGTLEVELGADEAFLTGPAVIIGKGEVTLPE